MTEDNLNLMLNVAQLPKQKSKPKSENASQGPKPFNKKFERSHTDTANSDQNVPKKGILKDKSKGTSNSIWKQFKQANKGDPKPIIPVFKKKNLEVKVKKSKNVKFGSLNAEKSAADGSGDVSVDGDSDGEDDERKTKKKKKGTFVHDKFHSNVNQAPGRHTSLFGNNPEIPQIPHKAVKPLKEPVFSSLCFKDMSLHPYMVKYLDESMGLTKMTTVQQKSIPVLLDKKDALIRSQTGSGKTLAFALPILHHLQEIRPKINRTDGVMALIVVPTRELALQTYELFNKLVKSYTWIVPGYLVGGEKRKSEKARLRKGISILIGTPGRLVDHLQNTSCLSLEKVSWLVLDEADRLFDMGYEKDVSNIIATLDKGNTSLLKPEYINPGEKKPKIRIRHTVLLSATLTAKVMELAGLSLTNPVFVDACDESKSTSGTVPIFSTDEDNTVEMVALPENLVQQYIVVPAKLRLVILCAFILWKCKLTSERKMLVFIATQDMVDYHAELLSTALAVPGEDDSDDEADAPTSTSGVKFFKLHGSMGQKERTEVFNTFRKADSGVLFCTDVAARGLDLPEVDWVVQYTGPTSIPDYVHRVGRTARGGQPGSSVIFLLPSEVGFIGDLENHRIRLGEEKMEKCLRQLWTFFPSCATAEEAASELQSSLETVASEQENMHDLACKAYSSWSRFYACYPRNMKRSFNIKSVHQGHYAKSFALRDTPTAVIRRAKGTAAATAKDKKPARDRPRDRRGPFRPGKRAKEVSEFDSGLEPIRKKTK
ncbi:UNVERIFIED_CONTAM: hypothetical protein PYX00_003695 [Menopon gallinae]|uniref:ATP-dependent RNA helicase n=1 Tax=Menopon gallinae TaxID=328185 RepID=A0AAW2I292_9NEOP